MFEDELVNKGVRNDGELAVADALAVVVDVALEEGRRGALAT